MAQGKDVAQMDADGVRPVLVVVQQHAEEAALLRHVRSVQLRSPHVQLHRLRRLDDRLAAHLDGLSVAGPAGVALLEQALASVSAGAVFAMAVMALQGRDAERLTRIVPLAAALPDAQRGLLSALGWVTAEDLQGTVRALLGSKIPIHRAWGLSACAMHRVDPGPILAQGVADPDPGVRVCAWRAAGRLGRLDLADAARRTLAGQAVPAHDADTTVVLAPAALAAGDAAADVHAERRAAAWALTLWRQGGNELVRQALLMPVTGQALPCLDAHRLATLAAPLDWGREQVRALAAPSEASAPHKRRMMQMAGWVGDVQVVPWLIHNMADDVWARLAGEVFSMITGADLAALDLERPTPEDVDFGPNADPDDVNVAMDEDDSLPWPDQGKVQAWWRTQAHRFEFGQRYFAGELPGASHCVHLLETAGQRQRIMAAEHLCLLQPASGLFPTAAPAWRQRRWLDAMITGKA